MIGIYLIRCKSENKVYIGQSNNIKKRYYDHIRQLKLKTHPNCYLQEAFDKYGESDFCCEVLHELSKTEFSRQKLYELEIQYISQYDSNNRDKGYNLESGGKGKGRSSLETRQKISNNMIGNKNNLGCWIGKHHSEETKKLLSEQRKGKPSHWRGKKQSKEHTEKITKSKLGKIWVSKGEDSRFVTIEVAEKLLEDGFIKGRPFKKRVKGKKYEYNGKLCTIPQIADLCGISKTVLQSRIRLGWSLEKATTTPLIDKKDNKGKYLYKGEYLNLKAISRIENIDYEVLRSRLRRGMNLEQAISKPIKK